jgi:GTP pyrophosphokinase
MHEIAEHGIAAHWKYKEGKIENAESDKIYAGLRQLLEWKDIKDPTEFLEAVKGELIPNMVYVFTPKGDLKELPNGATPVDFAYSIHTEIGNRCTRARVNGKLVPLDYTLSSGDTVEIVTSTDKQPSRDWLKFVVTSRAKTKIRSWLRTEEREQSKGVGKSICERKFRQHRLDFQRMLKADKLKSALGELGFKDIDEFYLAVGFGKVSVMELLKHVLPKEKIENLPEKESRIERIIRTLTRSTKSGVLVKGYDDVMIRFANCCTPLPGESIVGYITRGRGITIHNHDCSQLLDVDPARKIDVEWDKGFKGSRPAKIEVICADRPGVLSSITRSIASSDVNISKAEIHSTDDDRAIGTFEVAVSDLGQLEGVMKSIKKVKGVISVERILGAEEV